MLTQVILSEQAGGWYRELRLVYAAVEMNLTSIKNIQCNYSAVVAVSQPVLEFMTGAPEAKTIPFGVASWSIFFPLTHIFQNREVANVFTLLFSKYCHLQSRKPKIQPFEQQGVCG